MLKLAIIFAAVSVCYGQLNNRYFLYTGDNEEEVVPTGTTPPTNFVVGEPLLILIHSDRQSSRSPFNFEIRQQLREVPNVAEVPNVIVVDWETRAQSSYSNARNNVPEVARQLAIFINWLTGLTAQGPTIAPNDPPQTATLVEVNQIHLVGFGLGAHVAGIASRQLNTVVARITGLDPSGSGWGSRSDRLRVGDADYVEVIHTDGSGLLANGIGTAIGDVNFYVNGGNNQPGCFSHSCSHERAWQLFKASLEYQNQLQAAACSTTTQMNLNNCNGARLPLGGTDLNKLPNAVSKIYRINTGKNYPFFT